MKRTLTLIIAVLFALLAAVHAAEPPVGVVHREKRRIDVPFAGAPDESARVP
jgi:hypothetical protein